MESISVAKLNMRGGVPEGGVSKGGVFYEYYVGVLSQARQARTETAV